MMRKHYPLQVRNVVVYKNTNLVTNNLCCCVPCLSSAIISLC